MRSAVTALDKDLAIYQALSMKEVIRVQSWFYTVFGSFFMAFGCSALFLAMAGLYGVMSFAVSRRRKEMGIRMALGAQGGQLVRLIMRRAVIQMSLGLGLGLAIGLLAAGPLQPILYKVAPRDPIVSQSSFSRLPPRVFWQVSSPHVASRRSIRSWPCRSILDLKGTVRPRSHSEDFEAIRKSVKHVLSEKAAHGG